MLNSVPAPTFTESALYLQRDKFREQAEGGGGKLSMICFPELPKLRKVWLNLSVLAD